MYLFANSPTVDTLACKPTPPQLVAASCGACERPTLLFTYTPLSFEAKVGHVFVQVPSHPLTLDPHSFLPQNTRKSGEAKIKKP